MTESKNNQSNNSIENIQRLIKTESFNNDDENESV